KDLDFKRKQDAYLAVGEFVEQFKNPDDSLKGGVNTYAGPAEFESQLAQHLEAFARERLERLAPGALRIVPAGPPQVPVDYLRWLRERGEDIELLGLDVQHKSFARLSQVYVPLTTQARAPGERAEQLLRDAKRPRHEMLLARLGDESLYAPG